MFAKILGYYSVVYCPLFRQSTVWFNFRKNLVGDFFFCQTVVLVKLHN